MNIDLLPEETVVHKEKISNFYLIFLYLMGFLFLVFAILKGVSAVIVFMSLSFFVYAYCLRKFTHFVLTNKRIIYKTGIIGQRLIEIKIEKIESVQIYQGALGQIFNFGDLTFSGAGNPTVTMLFMEHPESFKKKYLELENSLKNNK